MRTERLLSIVRTQTELGRAIRRGRQLEAANQALQSDGRSPMLAESAAMRPVLEMIARLGPAAANVPITGENGTGKSLVAQALHAVSSRTGRPMVTVNAGGMAEGVFESELFGHLKGAFTDAKADRVGRFELADGSTLFLDEIANLPMTQQKLLRVIETGEFERLGHRPGVMPPDCRGPRRGAADAADRGMTRLSLVIPAYNEAQLLPRLLDTIDIARARYSGGAEAIEVVVADNGSTDSTATIASARGCRVAAVAKRMIGAARNGGAALATAPILCFVDADMQVHPETFNAIAAAIADPRIVGGATGVTMEHWSTGIALTYAVLVPFVWLTGMDTGVVFCRRDDFVRVGGYSESRHFAEDVDFLLKLTRLGWSRGQRLTRLRPVKAIASTRKFDRHGDWHYFTMMPGLAAGTLWPRASASRRARRYWYDDR